MDYIKAMEELGYKKSKEHPFWSKKYKESALQVIVYVNGGADCWVIPTAPFVNKKNIADIQVALNRVTADVKEVFGNEDNGRGN